mmetsp:Transcript_95855/g.304312  ORF Transcript_95855/g.304312 Transcript_95855/m.304312 type:complete len:225 (-) Transcript_95855:162-836(-)
MGPEHPRCSASACLCPAPATLRSQRQEAGPLQLVLVEPECRCGHLPGRLPGPLRVQRAVSHRGVGRPGPDICERLGVDDLAARAGGVLDAPRARLLQEADWHARRGRRDILGHSGPQHPRIRADDQPAELVRLQEPDEHRAQPGHPVAEARPADPLGAADELLRPQGRPGPQRGPPRLPRRGHLAARRSAGAWGRCVGLPTARHTLQLALGRHRWAQRLLEAAA